MDSQESTPPVQREFVPCANCGADELNIKFRISPEDNHHQTLWLNGQPLPMESTEIVVECGKCGLVFVNPRIAAREGLTAYDEEAELAYFMSTRHARLAAYSDLISRIPAWTKSKPESILDIGSGDGVLLEAAQTAGFTRIAGIEISPALIDLSNKSLGAGVVSGKDIQEFKRESFDVVALINVLEHVHAPSEMLARTWEVLKPGGIILVHVPNLGGLPARIHGPRWSQIEPYAHFYYFTSKTLASILDKNGFTYLDRFHLNVASGLRASIQDALVKVGLYLDNGLGMVAQKRREIND